MSGPDPAALLAWYDAHARVLPWRAPPGGPPADPYRVWLSEIMLQQTTVAAAGPYFERFLARWPNVTALAHAPREEVLKEWAGLGYYARARNLHACAAEVAARPGARFPETEAGLRDLPGVGPYTAGAIAAIAFGQRAAAVDGNVERVMARIHAIDKPMKEAKPEIRRLTEALVPASRPGDFAQALMDLGATICGPKRLICDECPWASACAGRAKGVAADLPRKAVKKPKPQRSGVVYAHFRAADGALLVERRPEKGLLGGMLGLPGGEWAAAPAPSQPPTPGDWRRAEGAATHVFTHFALTLEVEVAVGPGAPGATYQPVKAAREAAPTVFRKAIDLAVKARDAAPA